MILSTIDQVLSAAALTLVLCVLVWCLAHLRRDPLDNAPLRPNQLREDALALAVLVYLGAAVAISGIVQLVSGQTESVLATMVVGNGAHLAGIGACLVVAATRFQGGIRRFLFGAEGGMLSQRAALGEHVRTPHSYPGFTREGMRPGQAALDRATPLSSPLPGGSIALVSALTVMAIGLCPMIRDATMAIILYFAPGHEFDPHPTIKALHEGTEPATIIIALWVGAVVVAPVAEELFFRGLLQTFLVGVMRGRWLAIGLGSLVFGAVHFPQPHAVGALIVLGLLIGYAYERTGSLVPPIVIHAAFNLKTLIWDALGE